MDSYLKIPSSQGSYNAQQNILDFYIPSGAVYSLRDSFIELNCHAESTDGVFTDAIYSIGLRWQNPPVADANTQTHFINSALVKNCFMSTETRGMVESLRRVDMLRDNLSLLGKSQVEERSDDYLNANTVLDPKNQQHWGLFSDINKIGNVSSQYRDVVPIQIRLGDLMDSCNAVEMDTSLTGQVHIQVELNLDKVKAYQTLVEANNILPNPDDFTSTADNTDVNTLVFSTGQNQSGVRRGVPSLGDSPYYVGQHIQVSGTGGGGAGNLTDVARKITAITWDGTALTLTLNANLITLDNGQSMTDYAVAIVNADAVNVVFDSANVVLRQVANPQGMRQIAFNTYMLEEDNGNGQTSFRKQYQLPGEATNVMVMFPSENDDLNSVNANLTSFRLAINNKFLTDRDVDVDSPLYYNQLASTVQNMGFSPRNLQQNPGNSLVSNNEDAVWAQQKNVYVANYLQPHQQDKMLNMELTAGGTGILKLAVYSQVPRLLSL